MRVVVVAPHADDEILGCGGAIAKFIRLKHEVFIVIATNANIGAPELYSEEDIQNIRAEAKASHKFLGINDTIFCDFPAPSLNFYPEYRISLEFSKIFRDISPEILFLPFPGDLHQDHKAIYRSALVAARPINNNCIKKIYCYETLSETEWSPMHEKSFIPNSFIDVSEDFEKKINAFKFFKSQLKDFPHTRSIEAISALGTYRGATIGVEKAEAFILEREIF